MSPATRNIDPLFKEPLPWSLTTYKPFQNSTILQNDNHVPPLPVELPPVQPLDGELVTVTVEEPLNTMEEMSTVDENLLRQILDTNLETSIPTDNHTITSSSAPPPSPLPPPEENTNVCISQEPTPSPEPIPLHDNTQSAQITSLENNTDTPCPPTQNHKKPSEESTNLICEQNLTKAQSVNICLPMLVNCYSPSSLLSTWKAQTILAQKNRPYVPRKPDNKRNKRK